MKAGMKAKSINQHDGDVSDNNNVEADSGQQRGQNIGRGARGAARGACGAARGVGGARRGARSAARGARCRADPQQQAAFEV